MDRFLEQLIAREHFSEEAMAFVVGPRQVGKTTIAVNLLKKCGSSELYRNWDDLEWRKEYARSPYGFIDRFVPVGGGEKPLVVFDEIHKNPRWKRFLKGLYDTRKDRIRVLVTGSARMDIYRRGGDSLLGRYHQYRLHPLSVAEVVAERAPDPDEGHDAVVARWNGAERSSDAQNGALADLWEWGGFPAPFLRKNRRFWRRWLAERRARIFREDLRDLTKIQMIPLVEQLAEMIVLRAGSRLSHNALREDLQVSVVTITSWIRALTSLYFLYLVRPYTGKIQRALRKEPKVFLWEWSEVEEPGHRFENIVASHLLKWCHHAEDWGMEPLELRYVRDKDQREVDFLVLRRGKPWVLIETKNSFQQPDRHLAWFAERLGVANVLQICRERLPRNGMAGSVRMMDAASFLGSLPV